MEEKWSLYFILGIAQVSQKIEMENTFCLFYFGGEGGGGGWGFCLTASHSQKYDNARMC